MMALFIVFIMVMSTLGFIYSGDGSESYNGYKFQRTDFGWATYVNKINSYVYFTYLPKDVESFGDLELKGDFIYIVDNGNSAYGNKIRGIFSSLGIVSLYADFENDSSLPSADCNGENTVIVLNSNESSDGVIYNDGSCILLNGNLNKATDFVAYKAYGIIS